MKGTRGFDLAGRHFRKDEQIFKFSPCSEKRNSQVSEFDWSIQVGKKKKCRSERHGLLEGLG